MTDSKSDVLEVLFHKIVGWLISKIDEYQKLISTLYETISDLKNAPKLLDELINDDLYN